MAIGDDTSIDYVDKIIDVTGTTVYDVSVLYSYCKEQFKLSANIDDDFAWTANTPTDFTLKNGWYLRTHSLRRLKNGSIKTTYGTNEIQRFDCSTFPANFVEGDVGLTLRNTTQAADIGTLVDYDNTRLSLWVRIGGTTHNAASSDNLDATGGTGNGTSDGVEATGDDLWTNINTIGDLSPTGQQPLMYVYTGDLGTGDFAGNARKNEGWEDDPDPALTNSDRGALDVLIRIKDMGTTLGNPAGEIRVYGRQGLFKFADFPIDISAGGRISVPIAQSNDTEDTIGEVWLAIDGRNATDPVAGDEMTWTGGSAEVVSFIEGLASTNGVVQLRGLTAYPADGTSVSFTAGGTGVTKGSVGGQLITIDAETLAVDDPTDHGVVITGTSGAKAIVRGTLTLTDTGTGQGYIIAESNHDVKADSTYYTAFADNDNITGTGIDVTADFVTTPYSRLAFDLDDVQIKLAAWDLTVSGVGDAAVGDNISQATSGAKGTIISIPDATSLIVSWNNTNAFDTTNTVTDDDGGTLSAIPSVATRVSTFNYALSLQSSEPYYGLINCNGRTAAETFHYIKYFQQARATAANTDPNNVNTDPDQDRQLIMMKQELGAGGLIGQAIEGEEYFRAFTDEDTPSNNPTDQSADSRIAVKPGTSITTGQGWALINIAGADANNYVLTDTQGDKNAPLQSVTARLTNLLAGYHVQIVLDDGTGQEDESQFTLGAGNTAGNSSIVFNATLPNDTPTGSPDDIIVKVIDVSSTSPENRELRYRGTSWSGTTVTLATGATGQAEGTSSGNTLVDTAAFATVEVGDVIRNTTDGSFGWVKEKVDANTIVTTQLEGGTSNDWANLDNWETNTLAISYASGTDTAYIPYMDRVADATTEEEIITFVSNRNVVIRVRDTSILDFDTTGTINSTGISVGAVQTPDTVYAAT